MIESKKDDETYENTGDVLTRKARLQGMLGHFQPLDRPWPEAHVTVTDGLEHDTHEECWCNPTIEYHTDFIRVYRHRRLH